MFAVPFDTNTLLSTAVERIFSTSSLVAAEDEAVVAANLPELPEDVIKRIVSYSDLSTLVSCRKVNRFMQSTFEDELLQRMEGSSH